MNAHLTTDDRSPALALEALVARHGLVRVALTLARLLARRPARPSALHDHDLPDRLRRDIGLERLPESTRYWQL
ncbi:hypothetical protein DEA8626_00820 [Defluviimonas aquaemixtae]|uniref:DUF1127 domain-containing protein n=1 Tax=Albidovulum aquaemixtae TaxID=1542388 RepID=A0A2R8B483_9RHOB|nr:hypothetical protein [Defluviimonas aquaemixtae]SPH17303.1 hypothetical protein DEA8626_00820 [Defluviimonas aquaemixtae]